MSLVTVHGPNTMYTTQAGLVNSSPPGARATQSPTNGLVFNFEVIDKSRPATDYDWTFTGPGSPAAQADRTTGSVTYTGAGAGTIVLTVSGTNPAAPAIQNGTYTTTVNATAGQPRSLPPQGQQQQQQSSNPGPDADVEVGYDPAAHNVDEVIEFAESHPEQVGEILAAEQAGKQRSTLLSHLEHMQNSQG